MVTEKTRPVHWDPALLPSATSRQQERRDSKKKRWVASAFVVLVTFYIWCFVNGEFDYLIHGGRFPSPRQGLGSLREKSVEELFLYVQSFTFLTQTFGY